MSIYSNTEMAKFLFPKINTDPNITNYFKNYYLNETSKLYRDRIYKNIVAYKKNNSAEIIINEKCYDIISKIIYFFHGRSKSKINIDNTMFDGIKNQDLLYLMHSIKILFNHITNCKNILVLFENDIYESSNNIINGPKVSIDVCSTKIIQYNKPFELDFILNNGFFKYDNDNLQLTIIFPYSYIKYLIITAISNIIKNNNNIDTKNISTYMIKNEIEELGVNDIFNSFLVGHYVSKHYIEICKQCYSSL